MHTLIKQLSSCVVFCGVATGLALAASQIPDPIPRSDGKPADMTKPVKVFILMGQSNAIGFGKITGGEGSLENAVKSKGKYPYLVDAAGNWIERKDVRNVRVMCSGSGPWKVHMNEWMTIGGGKIGLEIGLGHALGYALDAPVMILKSAIGNRALGFDLLPPGAEGYAGNLEPPRKPKEGGEWYAGVQYDGDVRAALDVLADLKTYYPEATKYEVAGFFFWQGEKDCGNPEWADRYEANLVQFIKALRKDFEAPNAR
jgi:Carbohydrate esterase, sialic acid-specific acetylesterase